MIYLLNFNITYIIILATCFDSYESRTIVDIKTTTNHTPPQYHIDISSGFVMHKGIPIAIVRLRQKKTVRLKNCKTICTIVLEN